MLTTKEQPIIIIETVFCDTETNAEIIATYYERLLTCIDSVKSQIVDSSCGIAHIVYISEDKNEYVRRVRDIADKVNTDKFKLLVSTYRHPAEGYPFPAGSHVDLVKTPNRTPGYRDRLFKRGLEQVAKNFDVENAQHIVRIALDDDDLWAPWHAYEINIVAAELLESTKKEIIAIGLVDGYIAYIAEGSCMLSTVRFNRCLTGNKFIASRDVNKILTLSPWGIHDWLDTGSKRDFETEHNGYLSIVSTGIPSFCYFRRGFNLSQQSKDWCIEQKISDSQFKTESELISFIQNARSNYGPRKLAEKINQEKLKIAARLKGNRIRFTTNFSSMKSPGDVIAYYLLKDGARVDSLPYDADRDAAEFSARHGSGAYRIKAFLKKDGAVTETAMSTIVKI